MSGTNLPNVAPMRTSNTNRVDTSRVYSFSLTLATAVPQQVDLRVLQNQNQLKDVQSIYIDNSAGTTALSVTIALTNQVLTVPAGGQAILPAFVNYTNPVFNFSGNGTVNITLTNFFLPPFLWSATGNSSLVVVGGLLQVQDPALESLISNGALQASEALYGTGDIIVHGRAGAPYSGSITIPGTTTLIAGAPDAFLTHLKLYADPNIVAAATETLGFTIEFLNNTGTVTATIGSPVLQVPSVNAGALAGPVEVFELSDVNLIGNLTGGTLVVVATGTAPTAGAVRYSAIGGTTAIA